MTTYSRELEESLNYLNSDEAMKTVKEDCYWPKWNAPWWHMLLLKEMGEVTLIPEKMVREFIATLNKMPLKIFPIEPGDMPEGIDPYRGSPCHCQLGNVYQVLAAWGVNVDLELPWIRPWFLRYQMLDGGLNCDHEAYLVKNEVPSSMVGTIAVFEAVLLHTARPWTNEESIFLSKGAQFLMKRQLMLGSETIQNAAERKSAENWLKPCFPRFYLYDALRGLSALLKWSAITGQTVDPESIRVVVNYFAQRYPKGKMKIERQSFEKVGTILQASTGEWMEWQPASLFPLLSKVSVIGDESPFLTRQWGEIATMIRENSQLKNLL